MEPDVNRILLDFYNLTLEIRSYKYEPGHERINLYKKNLHILVEFFNAVQNDCTEDAARFIFAACREDFFLKLGEEKVDQIRAIASLTRLHYHLKKLEDKNSDSSMTAKLNDYELS